MAGPVARQAERGWALRDAEQQPLESFTVRSLLAVAGVQAALSICCAAAASPELEGRL